VLDHITAKIRTACPEAVYVTFAFYTSRTLDLHGVLGAQPSPLGTCPELWDNRDGEEEHPLDHIADQIESDVQTALAPYSSPAWASVHRNSASDGNSWLLELPPADRAARVAELVHENHPEATALVVDGRAAGPGHRGLRRRRRRRHSGAHTSPAVAVRLRHRPRRLITQLLTLPAAGRPAPDAAAERLRPPVRHQHQRSGAPDAAAAHRLAHGRRSR
jgi:hypothetical protein